MGKEKISKLMVKFCLPCILSLLVSALYNIVDQIFIGNSKLSTLGNAATGVMFPLIVVAQGFAWYFGDGCAAYMNIKQGKGDTDKVHNCIGTGMVVTFGASVILLAVFYPFLSQLLGVFGASENSMDYAVEYANIILAFFPVFMLSNMINSVIRADGSPAWSMASMLAGALTNIVLDPIFIFACDFGMSGAAWATGIGQIVSLAVCVFYLFRTKTFKLALKSFIPDFKAFKDVFKLGLSSLIAQLTIVVICLACNSMLSKYGAISRYGEDIPIAAIGIQSKVFTVVINIVVGIVLGCQPIIGYNMGAGNKDRIRKLYRAILLCTLGVGALATLLFECAPTAVAGMFGQPTNIPNPDDYWDFARKTFMVFQALIAGTCFVKMSSIFFQAVGKSTYSIITSLLRDVICFVPLVLTLPLAFGIDGVLSAAPIADAVSVVVTVVFTIMFFKGLKKLPDIDRDGMCGENADTAALCEGDISAVPDTVAPTDDACEAFANDEPERSVGL